MGVYILTSVLSHVLPNLDQKKGLFGCPNEHLNENSMIVIRILKMPLYQCTQYSSYKTEYSSPNRSLRGRGPDFGLVSMQDETKEMDVILSEEVLSCYVHTNTHAD